MSLDTYKIIHIAGLLCVFTSLAGLWGIYRKANATVTKSDRLSLALIHGLGMTLLLVSGFGQMARLGLTDSIPLWVYAKIAIWLLLGGSMTVAKRRAQIGVPVIMIWILLGVAAGSLALFKPF